MKFNALVLVTLLFTTTAMAAVTPLGKASDCSEVTQKKDGLRIKFQDHTVSGNTFSLAVIYDEKTQHGVVQLNDKGTRYVKITNEFEWFLYVYPVTINKQTFDVATLERNQDGMKVTTQFVCAP